MLRLSKLRLYNKLPFCNIRVLEEKKRLNIRPVSLINCRCVTFEFWGKLPLFWENCRCLGKIAVVWGNKFWGKVAELSLNGKIVQTPPV